MSKEKSHDALVKRLEHMLRYSGKYYTILSNVSYGTVTKTIGEIDLLALGYNVFDIYEVKGSEEQSSLCKAVEQVRTARIYFGHQGNEFIYTPQKGIEPLDAVVERLHRRRRNKKKRFQY